MMKKLYMWLRVNFTITLIGFCIIIMVVHMDAYHKGYHKGYQKGWIKALDTVNTMLNQELKSQKDHATMMGIVNDTCDKQVFKDTTWYVLSHKRGN